MASHRRPKQPGRARLTLLGAAASAAATVGVTATSASADPGQSIDDVREEVDELHHEAEEITEEYNGAKEREQELQDEIAELQDATARGQERLNELRNGMGSMASAQYRNGGLDPSMQLFLSSDPDAFLDQASALDQLSSKQADALRLIQDQQRTLDQQREEAGERLAELEEVRGTLGEQKEAIQGRLSEAQSLLNQLTEEERAAIAAAEQAEADEAAAAAADASRAGRSEDRPAGDVSASSRGQAALNAAATKLGAPYVWAASGPSSFDCSGLTSWAYSQAGVSLPRVSQAQANAGARVGMSELAPGDLVFYYPELTHVAIYAGNGQILHAPRPGGVVEYADINVMPFQFGTRVG
ncbi:NlpC/P60 family protein [Streptomyces sp. DSM 44915]|uniref:NlpC/P60 family protein n=1 Tax=Streptomyces chisholmiae TaxID=3075540 RepID=A0ABU2JIV8_9ACTN|nr:NlpC/P60 family protein [Streptomyces sp. DSM 44915]MDT0264930.1 NlpC/P60 family protein [Streptomyces sp. DSM 44915]